MATVASPDEAEDLVEDDTGDRGRKDHDDERRTVVRREHLNRRVVGVLRGQDDGQHRHCNANNKSDADTGSASIDVAGGCTFVGEPSFGRRAGAVSHSVPFDVVAHGRDDSSARLPSQAGTEAPSASTPETVIRAGSLRAVAETSADASTTLTGEGRGGEDVRVGACCVGCFRA
jgi:hypothetical protein